MTTDDAYAVLGVARDASPAEIGRAYRREVRRHHPDTAAPEVEDDARRRELGRVQAAYDVLRDPGRRAEYDRRHVVPRAPVTTVPSGGAVSVRVTVTTRGEPPLRAGPVRWERPGR
jgi:curved DNA-binding protein CbpA